MARKKNKKAQKDKKAQKAQGATAAAEKTVTQAEVPRPKKS